MLSQFTARGFCCSFIVFRVQNRSSETSDLSFTCSVIESLEPSKQFGTIFFFSRGKICPCYSTESKDICNITSYICDLSACLLIEIYSSGGKTRNTNNSHQKTVSSCDEDCLFFHIDREPNNTLLCTLKRGTLLVIHLL